MKRFHFPAALPVNTLEMDKSVLRWAQTCLVTGDGEPDWEVFDRCHEQKLYWLACYLFPRIEATKLEGIAKLFFCLLTLDDLLDLMDGEEAESLLAKMTVDKLEQGKFMVSGLGLALDTCYVHILEYFSDDDQKERFMHIWDLYIEGLLWEIKNKRGIWKLTLEDYQRMRPHSSGVYIVIELLRGNLPFYGNDTIELESDIARFIYLSNDLISASKEQSINDFNNEVLLISKGCGKEEAVKMVMGELSLSIQEDHKNQLGYQLCVQRE